MSTRPKEPVCEAVRKLRLALNESQEAFARRMGTAVRTVTRWETVRPPRGKKLDGLVRVARENGLDDQAHGFLVALATEIGLGHYVRPKLRGVRIP
jgi:transcriptional regulator with XRE-family HTH domain